MNKKSCIEQIVPLQNALAKTSATHFAPINIALVKYWGKRNEELNLPLTSSLSLSLSFGTHTTLSVHDGEDRLVLNGVLMAKEDPIFGRITAFLDLFRPKGCFFSIETKNDIPTGAGLASSASGFCALVLCLNDLFHWQLDTKTLSILARLGSGSACRSLYPGFVEWHKGVRDDGLDCYAEPLHTVWPELLMGLWIVSRDKKIIDSRSAMIHTRQTSYLYEAWPKQVEHDLVQIKHAIDNKDFTLFGKTCEHNALAMHATMLASKPSIMYFLPQTCDVLHKVWQLRAMGLEIYCTMDAGPNVKIMCLEKDRSEVQNKMPELQFVLADFGDAACDC